MQSFDPVDAYGLTIPPDHEIHGLLQGPVNVLHHRGGRLAHVEPQGNRGPESEQLQAEPISPALGTRLDVSERGEILEKPVDGGTGLSEAQ